MIFNCALFEMSNLTTLLFKCTFDIFASPFEQNFQTITAEIHLDPPQIPPNIALRQTNLTRPKLQAQLVVLAHHRDPNP